MTDKKDEEEVHHQNDVDEDDESVVWSEVSPLPDLPCSFESLALPAWMCRALTTNPTTTKGERKEGGPPGLGFRRPTPVQQVALPKARVHKHLVVQAKSGTGKTVTFACVAVEKAKGQTPANDASAGAGGGWSLVVAPTRELAMQHERVVKCIARHASDSTSTSNVNVVVAVGGTAKSAQENTRVSRLLRDKTERGVLIATPGRLQAIAIAASSMTQGTRGGDGFVSREGLRRVRCVVLDEADRLLDGNYDDQLGPVLAACPERAQVLAFSATYTETLLERVRSITGRTNFVVPFNKNTDTTNKKVSSSSGGGTHQADLVSLKKIKQYYYCVQQREHGSRRDDFELVGGKAKIRACVDRVLTCFPFDQCIVFCNNRSWAQGLVRALAGEGFKCLFMCGDMPQGKRTQAMQHMRSGAIRILVATDLVARGIDLERVSLVVNLDLPREASTLLHRVGRTGRFGTTGTAVHILSTQEEKARLLALLPEAGAYEAKVEALQPLKTAFNEGDKPETLQSEGLESGAGDVHLDRTPKMSGDADDSSRGNRDPPRIESQAHEMDIRKRDAREHSFGGKMDLDTIPDHIQRWMWWQWRYEWWCSLKDRQNDAAMS